MRDVRNDVCSALIAKSLLRCEFQTIFWVPTHLHIAWHLTRLAHPVCSCSYQSAFPSACSQIARTAKQGINPCPQYQNLRAATLRCCTTPRRLSDAATRRWMFDRGGVLV